MSTIDAANATRGVVGDLGFDGAVGALVPKKGLPTTPGYDPLAVTGRPSTRPMMSSPGFQARYRIQSIMDGAFQGEYAETQGNGRIVPSSIYRPAGDNSRVNAAFQDGPVIGR